MPSFYRAISSIKSVCCVSRLLYRRVELKGDDPPRLFTKDFTAIECIFVTDRPLPPPDYNPINVNSIRAESY